MRFEHLAQLFLFLVLLENVAVVQRKVSQILFVHESTCLIVTGIKIRTGLVFQMFKSLGSESILVQRSVFIEFQITVFGFCHHFSAEFQVIHLAAHAERDVQVDASFDIILSDVLLLLGQFVQLITGFRAQHHVCLVLRYHIGRAQILQIGRKLHHFFLESNVAFVGSPLRSLGVREVPVQEGRPKQVFTVQREVHGTLAFQAGILPRAGFGFKHHFLCQAIFIQILQVLAEAVFPVVPMVVNTFETDAMVQVELVIQRQGVTLAFALHKILAHLVIHHIIVTIIILGPLKLGIVRTDGIVLVRSGKNQSQLVVKEVVAVCESHICLHAVGNQVVTRPDSCA